MPRREGPTGARRVKAAERTRQAIALKKAGLSLEAIGQRLGISKAAAGKALHRGLAELRAETLVDAEELRAIEAARLDQAQAAIWPRVLQGNDGAIDRFVRLSQRRAALLGLDAPTKVDQRTELTGSWADLVRSATELPVVATEETGDAPAAPEPSATE